MDRNEIDSTMDEVLNMFRQEGGDVDGVEVALATLMRDVLQMPEDTEASVIENKVTSLFTPELLRPKLKPREEQPELDERAQQLKEVMRMEMQVHQHNNNRHMNQMCCL